jgi:hypothetical protein
MNFTPFVILWIVLTAAVLTLIAWRKIVAIKEDDNLILNAASAEKNAEQVMVTKKLALIDRWGKIVTVATVVYGVILGGLHAWQSWIQNSKFGA